MTDKELHRLKRAELISLLINEIQEFENLNNEYTASQVECNNLYNEVEHLKQRLDDKDDKFKRLKEKLDKKDEEALNSVFNLVDGALSQTLSNSTKTK